VRCTDPNNVNNFIVLSQGKIGIYKDVAGAARLFTPLKKLGSGTVQSGQTQELPGYWEDLSVFLFPSKVKTFDGQAQGISQKIVITDPSLSLVSGESNRYRLSTNVYHRSAPDSCGIPEQPSMRATSTSPREYTFGPFYCPGITSATAIFSVLDYNMYYEGAGDYYCYNRQVNVKMGTSDSYSGTYYYDSTITNNTRSFNARNFNISGSWSTARNYLKIHVYAYNTGGTYSVYWKNTPSLSNPHHSDVLGLKITTGERYISAGGSCNFVAVGE